MAESSNFVDQAALSELAGLLMATTSFEQLMCQLAGLAARLVPAALTCGITLSQDGRVITVASADGLAQQLDEQQYELDQGPCLQSLRTAVPVDCADFSVESRWDGYPARAVAYGVRSVHSCPLLVGGRAIGAMNVYAQDADAFDEQAKESMGQLAGLAAATITAAMRHYDQVTLTDHLRSALSSRSVIDQAIGIVIGMQHCSPDEAFDVLRTVSQNRNIRLRQVAAELVATTVKAPARPVPGAGPAGTLPVAGS